MTKACNQCGNEYQQIGTHWVQSTSCSHKEFTDYQREIITGLLMSDGCIGMNNSSKNPQLQVEMISKNYLQYVADEFGILGNDVKIIMKAAESAESTRKSGFSPNAKKENYSDLYRWRSISHPKLHEFKHWYSSGEKVWPEHIKLTPTVLKHWYCGDGYWDKSGTRNRIQIAMGNEVDETEKVSQMFENVGLPSPSNYTISERKDGSKSCSAQFTVDQSKELWEYMGEPLPDFEYKWPQGYFHT
jgi:hypothetical protein